MPKMDSVTLKSILAGELDNALGIDGGRLSNSRREALRYYERMPFGNEQAGRSQVVSADVMEVIEWVLPALLRIFTAGDETVKFEPQGPEDEKAAAQATDFVNFIFSKDNEGFAILYTWFKDALLQKNGFLKVYWNSQDQVETEHYTGLTDDEFAALQDQPDIEILNVKDYQDISQLPIPTAGGNGAMGPAASPPGVNPMAPPIPGGIEAPAPMLHDCVLKRRGKIERVKVEAVAPEEILISRRAISIEEAPFVCHRVRHTVSTLIELGYDEEQLKRLGTYDEQEYNTERIQRFLPDDEWPYRSERTDEAAREMWVNECYIRVDEDGDGIAELRKITLGGSGSYEILTKGGKDDDEEIDECPIISITPIPAPHKFFGYSLADLVMDLQLMRSVIWRQMLDNLYLSNNPRHLVITAPGYANTATIDDLLLSRPGGIVRADKPDAVTPLVTPFVADKAFEMMQFIDEVRESRTGVSRRNQGLAPDDLNKTASGMNMLQQAAAQRVELIARVFAETGMRQLFKRILGLVIRHQQKARIIKLRNDWVPMDPREWKENYNMTVSVGLGTGNRDQQLQHLQSILAMQMQAVQMQGGADGPIVTKENLYKTAEKFVQAAGFKNALDFVSDPSKAPPQQQKPDPKMIEQQAKMQLAQFQAQSKAQLEKEKGEREAAVQQQRAQQEMALEQIQAAHKMEIEKLQAQTDIIVAQVKTQLEIQKAETQARFKAHEQGMKMMNENYKLGVDKGLISYKEEKEEPKPDPGPSHAEQALTKIHEHLSKPKQVSFMRDKNGKIAGATIQ